MKKINRGYKDTLIIIPGFGFDNKIFCDLELEYNFAVYEKINDIDTNKKEIIEFVNSVEKQVYILAWSMGNFILSDIINKLNKSKIKKFFLVSVTEQFNKNYIDNMLQNIKNNNIKTLINFYKKVFFKNKSHFLKFKNNYMQYYSHIFSFALLNNHLRYLKKSVFNINKFKNYNKLVIQSENDIITSYNQNIFNDIDKEEKYIVNSTHFPFWNNEVIRILNEK